MKKYMVVSFLTTVLCHSILFAENKSFDDVLKSAQKGDSNAQVEIGWKYYKGDGLPQDYQLSLKWFKKAAEQGNGKAQVAIGGMYELGNGVPQNKQEAVMWYRRSAELGYDDAQLICGDIYHHGLYGMPKDAQQAFEWYEKAYKQGNFMGSLGLGEIYEEGNNYQQAVKWYLKSVEQGNYYILSHFTLMFNEGKCERQDYDKAIKLIKVAAERGEKSAQNELDIVQDENLIVDLGSASKTTEDEPWKMSLFLDSLEAEMPKTCESRIAASPTTNTSVGRWNRIKYEWNNYKTELGVNDWVLTLVLLLFIACCIVTMWGLCFLVKTAIKHSHIKFVISLSLLPGIFRLLFSAIFSSNFLDRLEDEPESFILTFAVGFVCVWIFYILWLFGLKPTPKASKAKNNIADCKEGKRRQAAEIDISPSIPQKTTSQSANNVIKPVKSKWFSCDWLSIWGFTPSKTSLIISVCAWILCIVFPPGGYGNSYLTSTIIGKIAGYAVGAILIIFIIPGIISAIMYHISKKSALVANRVFCSMILLLVICVYVGYYRMNGEYANREASSLDKPEYSQKKKYVKLLKSEIYNHFPAKDVLNVHNEEISSNKTTFTYDYEEKEKFSKEFLENMTFQSKEYLLELESIGWKTILDVNRIKTDEYFIESRAIIQKAKTIVIKYKENTYKLFSKAKDNIQSLRISETAKNKMLSGYDLGIQIADTLWLLEERTINEIENIINLLSAKKGAWVVEDGQILFYNDSNLDMFNSYIVTIQNIANQQEKIRRLCNQAGEN